VDCPARLGAIRGDLWRVANNAARAKAQEAVRRDLAQCEELVINPDSVHTRLAPRFHRLEQASVEAYVVELTPLDPLQRQFADLMAPKGFWIPLATP
jgi:hypothetical protein